MTSACCSTERDPILHIHPPCLSPRCETYHALVPNQASRGTRVMLRCSCDQYQSLNTHPAPHAGCQQLLVSQVKRAALHCAHLLRPVSKSTHSSGQSRRPSLLVAERAAGLRWRERLDTLIPERRRPIHVVRPQDHLSHPRLAGLQPAPRKRILMQKTKHC